MMIENTLSVPQSMLHDVNMAMGSDDDLDSTLSESPFPSYTPEIDDWEFKLDNMGPYAEYAVLKAHLDIAPDGAPSKEILSDLLLSRSSEA